MYIYRERENARTKNKTAASFLLLWLAYLPFFSWYLIVILDTIYGCSFTWTADSTKHFHSLVSQLANPLTRQSIETTTTTTNPLQLTSFTASG